MPNASEKANKNRVLHTATQSKGEAFEEESLFMQLVAPAFRRACQLQRQFERLKSHDVLDHQKLLSEMEQAEHNVWQAIALATADINPSLISDVAKAAPLPLSGEDKKWIEKCLNESSLPLMDEGDFQPIRLLRDR
jgi:hypothetical protein